MNEESLFFPSGLHLNVKYFLLDFPAKNVNHSNRLYCNILFVYIKSTFFKFLYLLFYNIIWIHVSILQQYCRGKNIAKVNMSLVQKYRNI